MQTVPYLTIRRLLLLCLPVLFAQVAVAAKHSDTISVYFPFNISTLTNAAQSHLDSLQYAELMDLGRDVLIVGYADFVGASSYNDTLSQKRAREVAGYLQQMGYRPDQIKLVEGKGELPFSGVPDLKKGHAPDRRVDIVFQGFSAQRRRQQDSLSRLQVKKKDTGSLKQKLLSRQDQPTRLAPYPARDPNRIAGPQPQPQKTVTEVKKTLDDLVNTQVNEAVVLSNVYFPANSHFVTEGSREELDRLLKILKDNQNIAVRIEGHICCVTLFPDAWDEDERDYNLSVNRAHFIYQYLIENGIDESRMSFRGFGRSRPVVMIERREEDAERNRRVEVRVMSK